MSTATSAPQRKAESPRRRSARKVPPSEGLFGVPGLLPHERGDSAAASSPTSQTFTAPQDAHVDREALYRANQRHFEESHATAIQGHIASRDRRSQGKRDHRGE